MKKNMLENQERIKINKLEERKRRKKNRKERKTKRRIKRKLTIQMTFMMRMRNMMKLQKLLKMIQFQIKTMLIVKIVKYLNVIWLDMVIKSSNSMIKFKI